MLICNLTVSHFGFALSQSNAVMNCLKVQLEWPDDKVETYTTIVSSASVAGVAFGAVMGGTFIANGRKRIILLFSILATIGCIMAMIKDMWVLTIGRLLYGYSAGVFLASGPAILNETIPNHLKDKGFGASTNISVNLFIFIAMFLGIGQPTDEVKLASTSYWRVVYGLPIAIIALQVFCLMFVHTEDSVHFHVMSGDK